MTLALGVRPYVPSPFVGPSSPHGFYGELMDNSTTAASAVFPGVNRAYYYPLVIPQACVAYRFFWLNGAAVSGTNSVQAGLYNDSDAGDDGPGTAFVLGTATTQAGTNACQFDDITDVAVPAGRFWFALWCSNTTSAFFRHAPNGSLARVTGNYAETGLTGGLLSVATPTQVAPYIAVCGFTTIASP